MRVYETKYSIGQQFNDWTLIARDSHPSGSARYTFRCVCGKEKVCNIGSVTGGASKGCGCKSSERQADSRTIHGNLDTLEYKVWEGARRWARVQKLPFQAEWVDFQAFLKDVGPMPSAFCWLRRKVSAKGWTCGNVAWMARGILDDALVLRVLEMRKQGLHRSVILRELHCSKDTFRAALDILIKKGLYKARQRVQKVRPAKKKIGRPRKIDLPF